MTPYAFDPITGGLVPTEPPQEAVQAVVQTYTASVTISAMKMLVADDATHVQPASNNTTVENARTLGIALNAAIAGDDVDVLMFGTVTDGSFSGIVLNKLVFLGSAGYLTQTVPVSPDFYVVCGKYIGGNTVFINVESPVQL